MLLMLFFSSFGSLFIIPIISYLINANINISSLLKVLQHTNVSVWQLNKKQELL